MSDLETRDWIRAMNRRIAAAEWCPSGLPMDFVKACHRSHVTLPSWMQALWVPLDQSGPPVRTGTEGILRAVSPRFPVPSCRLREGMALLRAALADNGLWAETALDQLIREGRLHFGAGPARCENRPDGPRVFLSSPEPCAGFWLTLGHEVGHALHFLARRAGGIHGPVSPLAAEKHALRLEWHFGSRLLDRPGWGPAVRACRQWRRRLLMAGHWRLHRFECSLYRHSPLTEQRVGDLWGAATRQTDSGYGWLNWFPDTAEPFYSWVYPVAWQQSVLCR